MEEDLELVALNKARKYCACQERCQSEVRKMLREKGFETSIIESSISSLIVDNYLSELRFAKLYAGGKFRIKNWGRIKIRHKLIEKKISNQCIKEGLLEVSDKEYATTLRKLVDVRWKGHKIIDVNDKASMLRYLRAKGFETDLIYKEMNRYSK